jgi:pimeloyl-ACP methyl ester carboxylesterase
MALIGALIVLVLLTQAGVYLLRHSYPQSGEWVEVEGGRLNVVDLGPCNAGTPPIVMIHGASSNCEVMRRPLGDLLARRHRVILIDRPGHGWSSRVRTGQSSPAAQAQMIAQALEKLGLPPVLLVVHSLSGALGARMALDHPKSLAGLVMLAPVTHPWRGGVGWYNKLIATPVVGALFAYTVTLPLGLILAERVGRNVFLPQAMPDDFVNETASMLLLRPRAFMANARDLVRLKQAVIEQVPRYGEIKLPITIISGDVDKTVSTAIHSRAFAHAVPHAKLVVLEGVGHMVQQAAPKVVMAEIEAMIREVGANL